MGEFRIGRTRAQHSYPDPRRDTSVQFARNFAIGPETNTAVVTGDAGNPAIGGTLVPWSAIESGATPGTTVPITPQVTGIVQIESVICLKNSDTSPQIVLVQVLIDGFINPIPELEVVTVPASGFVAIPVLTEIIEALPTNTTFDIAIRLIASANGFITIAMESSSIEIEEKPAATG